uniref:Uncharacterized protein n=1 Tax=Rhizophora mucronata TaxID=61149 RepID=A0A2P2R4J3_RHIMU
MMPLSLFVEFKLFFFSLHYQIFLIKHTL